MTRTTERELERRLTGPPVGEPPPELRDRLTGDIPHEIELHPDLAEREVVRYRRTETEVHLVLHTGVDTLRFTAGKNIHWHVNVPVRFVATDPLRQNIPWVEVTHPDGRTEVFQDVTQPLTAQQLAALTRREMDCLDCHNRVGHPFHNPEEVLDRAIADGRLDRSLLYLKFRALQMPEQGAADREEAERLVDAAREAYERDYPDIARSQSDALAGAAAFIREMRGFMLDLVTRTGFEDESVSWRSFPDNKGHKDFPGCFRCHNGQHQTEHHPAWRHHGRQAAHVSYRPHRHGHGERKWQDVASVSTSRGHLHLPSGCE